MKYRKLGALALAAVLLLTGCSSQEGSETGSKEVPQESTAAESQAEAAPEPFTIYCTDTLTAAFLEQYAAENPASAEMIQVQLVTEDHLAAWMENGVTGSEEAPDMVVVSSDTLGTYAEAGLLTDLASLGMTETATEQMYSFMKELGLYNGKLYGVTWQQSARAFVYNRTLAKEYLEVENNNDMQASIGEWSSLYNAAVKVNSSSEGTVKLLGSTEEIRQALDAEQPEWYVEGQLIIPDVMIDYLELYPAFLEEDLTWEYSQDSEEWLEALLNGSVIGCFGDAAFIQRELAPYVADGTGEWGFCYGPQNFVTEADMIGVTKDCQDTALAEELLTYLTCDEEAMETFAAAQLVPVNNMDLMKALSEEDTGKCALLKNQNILKGYTNVAGKISTKTVSEEEQALTSRFMEEIEACLAGEKDIEQALTDFAADVVKE